MASPAIGNDGTVYITAFDGNLYAFGSSEQKKTMGGESTEGRSGVEQQIMMLR